MTERRETQRSINAWQRATFPHATMAGIVRHIHEEFEEWVDAEVDWLAAEEAADLVILLYAWCDRAGGIDLHAEIDRKMRANRARQWRIQPDGTGRHT